MTNGTHKGGKAPKTIETAALTFRHALVSPGTTQDKIVACPTAGIPLGTCTDEGAVGDAVDVQHLGSAEGTVLMIPEASITTNVFVVPGVADGKVRALPTANGTYYIVGRVVKGGAADLPIEVDPIAAVQRVVAT